MSSSAAGGGVTRVPLCRLRTGDAVSRIIQGCWQLAGGHGDIDAKAYLETLDAHHAAGIDTVDTADIYGPSQRVIGAWVESRGYTAGDGTPTLAMAAESTVAEAGSGSGAAGAASGNGSADSATSADTAGAASDDDDVARTPFLCTKYCRGEPSTSKDDVRLSLAKACAELKVPRVGLVAMHWWDWGDRGHVTVAQHLAAFTGSDGADALTRNLGVTNYDCEHLRELLDAGVPVATNQVQVSLLDRRALKGGMADLCEETGVKLIAYGSVGGGLLSERWRGKPPPTARQLSTASLRMYYTHIARHWTSWDRFQELLGAMQALATKHACTIANVAVAYVLAQPCVAAVIVGARNADSVSQNVDAVRVAAAMTAEDLASLDAIVDGAKGPEGDVYGIERGLV